MTILSRLLPKHFAAETRGSVTVETLIIFPTLAWALAATVVFFDGFRTRTQTQVAAQVVADLLSREPNMFTTNYLEGMNNVFDFLADSRFPTRLRVSSVLWNSAEDRNALQWSYGTRGLQALPPETFDDLASDNYPALVARFGNTEGFSFASAAAQAPVEWLADRIPPVLPGEALIMVESFALWSPFANVGVGEMRFNPIVVTRPRFSPWINLEGAVPVFPESDYEVTFAGHAPVVPPPAELPPPVPQPSNTVVSQSFDTGGASGWSSQTITATNRAGIGSYLGPFSGTTWDAPVTRSVDLGAADRATARIEFDLLIMDTWDGYSTEWSAVEGDIFQILINGTPISSDVFYSWSPNFGDNARTSRVNHEGAVYTVAMTRTFSGAHFASSASADQIWRVTVDIQAPPRVFTLGFRSRSDNNVADESWGIDNIQITHGTGTRTPAPFTANASALLGADPHTRFRRYSGCPNIQIAANWMTVRNTDLATALQFRRLAGGTQNLANCNLGTGSRFISAQPAFVLNYTNDGNGRNGQRLRLRMEDGNTGRTCDTTFMVRDPNGQWWYNDDLPNYGWNAGLAMGNAPTGLYHVFIGTYNSGTCQADIILERY